MLQVSDFDPSNTCSEQRPATSDKVHIVPRITFNIYCITKKILIHPTLAPNRGQPPATRSILYPGSPEKKPVLKIDYGVQYFPRFLQTKCSINTLLYTRDQPGSILQVYIYIYIHIGDSFLCCFVSFLLAFQKKYLAEKVKNALLIFFI